MEINPTNRPDRFDRASARLRREHSASVEWLPGAIAWFCSCGARSVVSGGYRTEAQIRAALDRHLRAAVRRYLREDSEPASGEDSAE